MLVKAQPGGKFPMLNGSHYITESRAVEVPNLSYYRRAVEKGSLLIVEPEKPKPARKSRKKSKHGGDK